MGFDGRGWDRAGGEVYILSWREGDGRWERKGKEAMAGVFGGLGTVSGRSGFGEFGEESWEGLMLGRGLIGFPKCFEGLIVLA